MEFSICILKATIAVEQRMSKWICRNCRIKRIENKRIIVRISDHKRHNPSVIQIQNCTQIHLANFRTNVILEFRYICKPFFIGFICMEIPVQYVFCNILRIRRMTCAAMICILNCRLHTFCTANSQNTLVIYRYVMVTLQIITNAPISFIR